MYVTVTPTSFLADRVSSAAMTTVLAAILMLSADALILITAIVVISINSREAHLKIVDTPSWVSSAWHSLFSSEADA